MARHMRLPSRVEKNASTRAMSIFGWPGMGRVIVDDIFKRDYPLVMATSFIFAVVVVLGSLVADILYAVADPRIRYD